MKYIMEAKECYRWLKLALYTTKAYKYKYLLKYFYLTREESYKAEWTR